MNAILNMIQSNYWVGQILQGNLSPRHTTALVVFLLCNLVILMVVAHDVIRTLKK